MTTSARTVPAACPHDCPDTCAMLVTVDEDGRATGVAGNPEQPVTAGFYAGRCRTTSTASTPRTGCCIP